MDKTVQERGCRGGMEEEEATRSSVTAERGKASTVSDPVLSIKSTEGYFMFQFPPATKHQVLGETLLRVSAWVFWENIND